MGIVLGIDIGSSATKIVAMDESKTILNSLKVSASDPVTAMYGAVGKILCEERMQISDVEAVMLTGMGASYVEGDVYGLPTTKVTEFDALGTGGLYLTGLEETVVGSIGTGTVFVHAGPDGI
ncbi:MAG: pantothenate kinase, partial [Coprococcus catus]|nr:pantothenate kinase [Coprococcus catus]